MMGRIGPSRALSNRMARRSPKARHEQRGSGDEAIDADVPVFVITGRRSLMGR
jgi:hypothetical protein